MASISLPPGFQFHPTDVELIMYYLKRKLMGKKNHVIAVVNIYKFSPWDLPDKSCLRSRDFEWFFFCPREKYVSGGQVKRATEDGYWKTTGNDRTVSYNGKTVGTVKSLVFHLGHAPQGQITDWVMHEYMILDDNLAASGDQDTYVLCKLFKKNDPGPKNGTQYGKPFKGVDWTDVDGTQNHARSLIPNDQSLSPLLQSSLPKGLFNPGSTSGPSMIKEGPNVKKCSLLSGLSPGITPWFSECLSPSARSSTREYESADDDITRLLASFTDESMLLTTEKENHKDDLSGKMLSFLDEFDVYNGLKDIVNDGVEMNETRPDFSEMQNNFPRNEILLEDNLGYIELNDLLVPLNCSAEVNRTDQSCDDIFYLYGENMCSDDFNEEDGNSDVLKKFNNRFNQRSNVASHGLEHTLIPHNGHKEEDHFIQGTKRGRHDDI